ncbi:MAG TPA: WD40 repeat domain-containing protein, partial [Acidimicrobiales bacterium]
MFDVRASREVWVARFLTAHGTEFSSDGERLAVVQTNLPDEGLYFPVSEDRLRSVPAVVLDSGTGAVAFTAGALGEEGGFASDLGRDPTVVDEDLGRDAAWSPDGRLLATSRADGTVVLSDAVTGARRFAITADTATVNGLAWSPDGSRLATASDDGTARVIEITPDGGGATTSVFAHDTDRGLVSVAFSPSGDQIITGVAGRTEVKVWDIGTTGGAEWLNVAGHSVRPGTSALAFTPDGDTLVVGGQDGTIAGWDLVSGRRLWTSTPVTPELGEVVQVAVSPDGALIASAQDEGPVDLWDASTGGHLRTVLDRLGSQQVVSMTWSHDGDVLAVARTDDLLGRIDIVNRAGERVINLNETFWWGTGSVSFSPDDRLLVTTRLPRLENLPRQELRVWDWERGETVRSIEAPVVQAAFDPRSPRIAARLEQAGTVGVWDAGTGEQVATLVGPAVVNALAYGSDGSRVATAGADGVVRVWDPGSGEQDLELRGHGTTVQAVVFSPDGTRLASVGNDGVVRVWALELDD